MPPPTSTARPALSPSPRARSPGTPTGYCCEDPCPHRKWNRNRAAEALLHSSGFMIVVVRRGSRCGEAVRIEQPLGGCPRWIARTCSIHEHEFARRQGVDAVFAACGPRGGGLGEVDMAQALVAGGELSVSATGRRILSAKMLTLSALALAFIVVGVVHRRHLDASKTLPPTQPYPPHGKPGW